MDNQNGLGGLRPITHVSDSGAAAYPEGYTVNKSSVVVLDKDKVSQPQGNTSSAAEQEQDRQRQWREYYQLLAENYVYDEKISQWVPRNGGGPSQAASNESSQLPNQRDHQYTNSRRAQDGRKSDDSPMVSDQGDEGDDISDTADGAEGSLSLGEKALKKKERRQWRKDKRKERKLNQLTHLEAGGQKWQDKSLADWDPNDFRLFVGNIGPEVGDAELLGAFARYPSVKKARAVHSKDHKGEKSLKGYGFVSFGSAMEMAAALREMQGKYVGNRPVTLKRSKWKDRIRNA